MIHIPLAKKDIPDDYETLQRYNVEYERTRFEYAPVNKALAVRTEQMFLNWYLPRPLIPLGAPAMHALTAWASRLPAGQSNYSCIRALAHQPSAADSASRPRAARGWASRAAGTAAGA